MEPLRFALLGLGAGAGYALISQGLVLLYRGAGIVNFAQGGTGVAGALVFFELRDNHGVPPVLAFGVSMLIAALLGAAIHTAVLRPLASAAPLVRLISTLAVLSLLLAVVQQLDDLGSLHAVLPTTAVQVLPGVSVGADRLILFGIAVAVTAVLSLAYRTTWFGLATSAISENARTARAVGISPNMIAVANWSISSMLAAAGVTLIASLGVAFDPASLALLVIPGLAAALLGGFSSFWLSFLGGLAIGIAQSELGRYVTQPGWANAGPFLAIIMVLVVRGRALPMRGEAVDRMPRVGDGAMRTPALAALALAVGAALLASPLGWVDAMTTTALAGMVVMSLVVVAGYAGQVSLAQYALAGTSALVAARLISATHIPFELAAVAGVAAAVVVGLFVGIAALRSRGVNLAIATLGAAVLIEQVVLSNPSYTGGAAGTTVGEFRWFGIDVGAVTHPRRFAVLVFAAFAGLAYTVAKLRRSAPGRRMIALRSNERAAAATGVNIFTPKLIAFAVAAAVAGVAGALMAFEYPSTVFAQYTALNSINAVMQAVVGGIGHVSGAIAGGTLQPGSVGERISDSIFRLGSSTLFLEVFGAVCALFVLIMHPDGIASRRRKAGAKLRQVAAPPVEQDELSGPRANPATLRVHELTVTFGGVRALSNASVTVAPGEVVGVIGPNGSGKTTLIDAITGFVRPNSGTVMLGDVDLTPFSASRRVGYGLTRTFQSLELFTALTVRDNLRVAIENGQSCGRPHALLGSRRQTESEVRRIAALLELDADLNRFPEDLPFGRRRLVALARAIAAWPSVLLLDEPAAGLGSDDTQHLGRLLRRLTSETSMAVLVVEHDVGLIANTCDRVVVLDRGVVIASDSPAKALAAPQVQRAYFGEDQGASRSNLDLTRNVRPATVARAPLLRASGLDCGYGKLAAVRQLDLELRSGEVVALLGPNGAGKTTTLLTLAGELQPLRGAIECLGETSAKHFHHRVRQGLGLVTEERATFSRLTTRENLRLGRGPEALALDMFPELRGLLNRRAGLLSGGEQQMLALGRTLAAGPAVLMVDELSVGLAPAVVDRLFGVIREVADAGTGVIIVEQFVERALELADRAYVLHRGRLVLSCAADELRRDPGPLRQLYLTAETARRA